MKPLFFILIIALILLAGCGAPETIPPPAEIPEEKPAPQPAPAPPKPEPEVSPEPAPTPAPTPQYVGSVNSNIYHYPDCRWAKKIKPENEIWFTSLEDAKAHGYRPCKVCKPPG